MGFTIWLFNILPLLFLILWARMFYRWITIWLFNIFIGKSSISMGHLYHGDLLNNQRVMCIYKYVMYII
jgi:hypothetical protein